MSKKRSGGKSTGNRLTQFNKNQKAEDIRLTNIAAAKSLADVVRTSLGPRGMDKMIQDGKGQVLITNDGATILKKISVVHPTAKMLVEISKAQDIEAGDGTTSVVVVAGALLQACQTLLERGIHPTTISEGYQLALTKGLEILNAASVQIKLEDRMQLIGCVSTSLSSKVVSSSREILAPLAVDAVMSIVDPKVDTNVDLRNIRVNKKKGGTIDETSIIDGLCFPNNRPRRKAGGPTKMANAKIAVIQFCLSSPKTDIENTVTVKTHQDIDRILREEKKYIAKMIIKIYKSGANVLLMQKSILRDAVNELSLHYLAKKKIMVVTDIEREDVPFICKTLGCKPISHIDHLKKDKLGFADLVNYESQSDGGKVLKITGLKAQTDTVSILVRGSNNLVIDETERSLHDALCVVRCLVKNRGIIPGGGAIEIELAQKLAQYARTLQGAEQCCVKAFADALQIIPFTLAENAGLDPIQVVTDLRNKHAQGHKRAGINVKSGKVVNDIMQQKYNIKQPTLVTESALALATETVRMILKIDDLVLSAR